MAQEHVELTRRIYAHFNETGEPPWEHFHPDAEFDATNVVGMGVARGREGFLQAYAEYAAAWDEWRIEPEEFLESGERVLAVVLDGGRLKGSGGEVHNRFFNLLTFEGGKVARWKTFTDRDQALRDLGLEH